jgi:hypothetical protein
LFGFVFKKTNLVPRLVDNPCAGSGKGDRGPSYGLAKMLKAELKKRSTCRVWLVERDDSDED